MYVMANKLFNALHKVYRLTEHGGRNQMFIPNKQ